MTYDTEARLYADIAGLRAALLDTIVTLHDGGGPAHHPVFVLLNGGARTGYCKLQDCPTAVCRRAVRLLWPETTEESAK